MQSNHWFLKFPRNEKDSDSFWAVSAPFFCQLTGIFAMTSDPSQGRLGRYRDNAKKALRQHNLQALYLQFEQDPCMFWHRISRLALLHRWKYTEFWPAFTALLLRLVEGGLHTVFEKCHSSQGRFKWDALLTRRIYLARFRQLLPFIVLYLYNILIKQIFFRFYQKLQFILWGKYG